MPEHESRTRRTMSHVATAVGILAAWIGSSAAWAQSQAFTPPRTSFGHPDLSGTWTNNNATPLQRPSQWADKELLTDAELAAVQSAARELEKDGDARALIKELGLEQVSDQGALTAAVDKALADHPGEAEAYRAGKTQVLGFFVGKVMKAMGGKANPQILSALVKEKLGG